MRELRLPTEAEAGAVYRRDLETSFPPEELKPFFSILKRWKRGKYLPWCLFTDNGEIAGECFMWLGNPGYVLLDYLCVRREKRNSGLGLWIIGEMRRLLPGAVILCESEAPEAAPDRAAAERRLRFYRRSGIRDAGFQAEVFGVRYQILCWAEQAVPPEVLAREYQAVYRQSFSPEAYRRYIRIPFDGQAAESRETGEGKKEGDGES